MYPDGQLAALARHKGTVLAQSAYHRRQMVIAARGIERSIGWVDRAITLWHKLAPLAKFGAVPLAFLFRKFFFPKIKIIGPLLRWGPVAYSVFRSFRAARR